MAQLKTASVLAFERKLANSDGLMYSGSWGDQDKAACSEKNRSEAEQWTTMLISRCFPTRSFKKPH